MCSGPETDSYRGPTNATITVCPNRKTRAKKSARTIYSGFEYDRENTTAAGGSTNVTRSPA